MEKVTIAILIVLLLVSNGYWLYRSIDSGVTETYRDQVDYEQTHRIAALQTICSQQLAGMPKAELVSLLQTLFPDTQVFEKDDHIHTTWLSVRFDAQGYVDAVNSCSPSAQSHSSSGAVKL